MSPIRRFSQDAVRGDPLFYQRRLEEHRERVCLEPKTELAKAFLRKNPVTITDIPKRVERKSQPATEKKTATFESTEGYLEKSIDASRHSRTISVSPANPGMWSWSQLSLSVSMLNEIMSTYEVMPGFLDYVHMFGNRTRNDDSAFGGGIHEIHFSDDDIPGLRQYEISYSANYVVHKTTSNSDPENPWSWSLRKTAVYQKFDYETQSSTWITVFPSERVKTRIQETLELQSKQATKIGHTTIEAHVGIFANAAENWRSYYNCLDKYLEDKTEPALHCKVHVAIPKLGEDGEVVKDTSDGFDVKFEDLQTMQKLEERAHEFERTLEANKDALQTLKQLNEDVYRFSSAAEKDEHSFYRVGAAIDRHLQTNNLQQKNIESLLRRIKGRFQLLYNILDLQNSTIVSVHEAARTNFQNLERRETVRNAQTNEHMFKLNTEMRDMTHGMRADAISMKIITFVALIYLPITFIATILSAGITEFDHKFGDGGDGHGPAPTSFLQSLRRKISFSNEAFMLFWVLSIPLLAVTIAGWYIFARRMNQRLTRQAEAKEAKFASSKNKNESTMV